MTEQNGSPETTTMRRLKRSRVLQVSSLMATAGFTLAACGSPAQNVPVEESEPALAYTSLEECRTADVVPDAECDAALAEAQRQAAETAPRYGNRETCEATWGTSACQETRSGGGSFFTPLVAGFVIGRLLDGGRYYGGGPLYRDREDQYSNGFGGGYTYRDYRTGRRLTNAREHGPIAGQAPARMQSRTAVVSRGGFGGGGRGFGG